MIQSSFNHNSEMQSEMRSSTKDIGPKRLLGYTIDSRTTSSLRQVVLGFVPQHKLNMLKR